MEYWNTKFVLFATFFFIIGGTLGGGIMIVPVEQAMTGFWAFLAIMILPFIAECVGVVLFMQIIQKVRRYTNPDESNYLEYIQSYHEIQKDSLLEKDGKVGFLEDVFSSDTNQELTSFCSETSADELLNEEEKKMISSYKNGSSYYKYSSKRKDQFSTLTDQNSYLMKGVDLHTISSSYFPWYYGIFVDFLLLLESFPLLYVIGASQSMTSLFTDDPSLLMASSRVLAPLLAIGMFTFVFLFSYIIEAIISFLTCIKASLLLFVVLLGLGLASPFVCETNILYFSRVLFAETWLICGSVVLIPTLFSKLRPTKRNVIYFTCVVVFALSFSQIICVLWSIVIWGIVPQDDRSGSKINLMRSLREGELSSIPFALLLREKYPQMAWISYMIQVFVTLSLCVSSLVFSTVFKSMIDGFVRQFSLWSHTRRTRRRTGTMNHNNNGENNLIDNDEPQRMQEGDYPDPNIITPEEQQEQEEQEEQEREEETEMDEKEVFQMSVVSSQILSYLLVIILITSGCFLFYKMEFFLTELNGFLLVMIEVFFLCGLVWVDIIKKPLKREMEENAVAYNYNNDGGIWFKLPKPLYVSLALFLGAYFLGFSAWFYFYSTVRWVYTLAEKSVPF